MPNEKHEAFCMREYTKALEKKFLSVPVKWELARSDPPDFWLTLGTVRWGVEITTIVDGEDSTNWSTLCRSVKQVEKEAKMSGNLSGTYMIKLGGKLDDGRQLRKFRSHLTKYVKNSFDDITSADNAIIVDGYHIAARGVIARFIVQAAQRINSRFECDFDNHEPMTLRILSN